MNDQTPLLFHCPKCKQVRPIAALHPDLPYCKFCKLSEDADDQIREQIAREVAKAAQDVNDALKCEACPYWEADTETITRSSPPKETPEVPNSVNHEVFRAIRDHGPGEIAEIPEPELRLEWIKKWCGEP